MSKPRRDRWIKGRIIAKRAVPESHDHPGSSVSISRTNASIERDTFRGAVGKILAELTVNIG